MRKEPAARRAVAAVLLCSLGVAGCYRTTAIAGAVPPPSTRIVADLTPLGTQELAVWIGADAVAVEGRVVEADADTVRLEVLRVDHANAPSILWNGERVAFPTPMLRNLRERERDPVRTGLLSVGLVSALTALAVSALQSEGLGSGGDGGGGSEPPQ